MLLKNCPAGQKARVFSTIGLVGAAGESIELEDEEDAIEDKKITGIDVAALKKKVAAKGRASKGRIKASGRARKLADQQGIDISHVEGSGPKGRITEKDVQAYFETAPISPKSAAAPTNRQRPRPAPPIFAVRPCR